MNTHREHKQAIRAFMQAHYTDERLAWLLAHARDGKLAFNSCCCFIGVATSPADHKMQPSREVPGYDFRGIAHYAAAKQIEGAMLAEQAFNRICRILGPWDLQDTVRRRILIPMVRAEMRRRAALIPAPQPEAEAVHAR